jgi:colicin import membrane protein
MNAAAQLPFQPADNVGAVRSFVLAAVVHVLLFLFLYFGISWQSKPPAPAAADLWSPLPPMSAPVAAPPPPQPVVETPPAPPVEETPPPVTPKADILEKIEKPVKRPPPAVEPPKEISKPAPKPAAVKPLPPKSHVDDDIQRELNKELASQDIKRALQKEMNRDANAGGGRPNSTNRDWSARVASMIRNKVPVNVAEAVTGNPTAEFEVHVLPGREVGLVKLTRSSGNPAYDAAAQRAIESISPLPPKPDGSPIDAVLKLTAKPKDDN